MKADAIDKIIEMKRPEKIKVGEFDFFLPEYKRHIPPTDDGITIHTLDGLATFIEATRAEMREPVIHVVSHRQVLLLSGLDKKHRSREQYCAITLKADDFEFDRFHGAEMFNIMLQSLFIQDHKTSEILKVAGNITAQAELKTGDDGVSQDVTAKVGLAKVEQVLVPNPVELQPYRTFREVKQPPSKFVFRMKGGIDTAPSCALFEADGGCWKMEAIKNIAEYLAQSIPDIKIIA